MLDTYSVPGFILFAVNIDESDVVAISEGLTAIDKEQNFGIIC